jgi:esterase FrsA
MERGKDSGLFVLETRSLDEVKEDILRRAQMKKTPLKAPTKMQDVHLFLSRLTSMDRDHWAAEWIRIGEPYEQMGNELLSTGKRKEALEAYYLAYRYYYLARYPTVNSPKKKEAYNKTIRACLAAGQLFDPPMERIAIPFEGKEIVGYMRLPKEVNKPPLIFSWGGIDAWKEDERDRIEGFLREGWGSFIIDIPGTGESPILAKPDSDRLFRCVIDYLESRPDIDGNRLAITGTSFGGYWATRMAYVEHERIRAAVNWGGPVHFYFQPEWQRKTLQKSEYLYDWFEAQAALYGVTNVDDFLKAAAKLSLETEGILDCPSCPILTVNGKNDTLIPISDHFLLAEKGSPKTMWINPQGRHMGHDQVISNEDIHQTVVIPWLKTYVSPYKGQRIVK